MRQFMLSIPDDEIWSARVDGASEWRIYRSVVLPQFKPALATLGMLTFMFHWNAYLWPLIVLTEQDKRTLPIILTWYSTQHTAQLNLVMAASVLMVIPVLIVFALVPALDRARPDPDGNEVTTSHPDRGRQHGVRGRARDRLPQRRRRCPRASSASSTSIRRAWTSLGASPSI